MTCLIDAALHGLQLQPDDQVVLAAHSLRFSSTNAGSPLHGLVLCLILSRWCTAVWGTAISHDNEN